MSYHDNGEENNKIHCEPCHVNCKICTANDECSECIENWSLNIDANELNDHKGYCCQQDKDGNAEDQCCDDGHYMNANEKTCSLCSEHSDSCLCKDDGVNNPLKNFDND